MFAGRCIFPATGYLELVWSTFAQMKGQLYQLTDVEFENIRFLRATAITFDQEIELTVMIHYGNGKFEVSEGSTSIVTGTIRLMENTQRDCYELFSAIPSDLSILKRTDFYKELRLRGYQYSDAFCSVVEARNDGLYGKIKWDLNWVSFMDAMLQIRIISKDTRSLMLPTRIRKLTIKPKQHILFSNQLDPNNVHFEVCMNAELNVIKSGGIEITGLDTNIVSRRKDPGDLILESYQFISHNPTPKLSLTDGMRVCIQLALENNPTLTTINGFELDPPNTDPLIFVLDQCISEIPLINSNLTLLTSRSVELNSNVVIKNEPIKNQKNNAFAIISRCLSESWNLNEIERTISDGGYLLSRESLDFNGKSFTQTFQHIATIVSLNDEKLILLKRKNNNFNVKVPVIIEISVEDKTYSWLDRLRKTLPSNQIILFVQNEPFSGIIGLVNCIRKEINLKEITCFLIDDPEAPIFNCNDPFYNQQIALGWPINIYRNVSYNYFNFLICT